MSEIALLQVFLSAALFLVLWGFLSPIVRDFVAVIADRMDKTDRSEGEIFSERLELKELEKELIEHRLNQSARGVKAREEIVELAKSNIQVATKTARDEAAVELMQFKDELADLRSKLEREIESESIELSKVIIEKVSAGSGLNPQTVH
jgi:F0F1-type ATP synthase membrane subunit b/b'